MKILVKCVNSFYKQVHLNFMVLNHIKHSLELKMGFLLPNKHNVKGQNNTSLNSRHFYIKIDLTTSHVRISVSFLQKLLGFSS